MIFDEPRVARTGVTVILPREGSIWKNHAFAASHTLNGSGEMTGAHWIAESGMLTSPIAITNTAQVGAAHEALNSYAYEFGWTEVWDLPVVAESWDGWLSDMAAFHVTKDHVYQAIESAQSGPVAEGNVGGGTGMICHEFKGGIGTASRMVACPSGTCTVGALAQANYGARAGGMGYNGSGDIFRAFATGNQLASETQRPRTLQMLPNDQLNSFFLGVAEAVEEAILNALTAAETMTGFRGADRLRASA